MDHLEDKCQFGSQRCGLVFFCTLFSFLFLDQWTKYLVTSHMAYQQTIKLPVDFVQLTYVRNIGGAFGMMAGKHTMFAISALSIIGLVYWIFPELCAVAGRWGAGISATFVAGTLGNLFDRVRLGYVVDMIDLKWWPVFNVADIGITVSVTIYVLWIFFSDHKYKDYGDNIYDDDINTVKN